MMMEYKKPFPYPGASVRLADIVARVEKLYSLIFMSETFGLETAKECLQQIHVLQLLVDPQVYPDLFKRFHITRELCNKMVIKGVVSKDIFINLFEMLSVLLSASGLLLALHSPQKPGLIKEYKG